MSDWALADEKPVRELARRALQTVTQGFEDQTMRAQLKVEYDALLREQQYNDLLGGETLSEDGRLTGLSGAQLMKLLMAYRQHVEQGKKVGTWVRLKWALTFGFRLFSLLKGEATEVIAGLEKAFYRVRKVEIERELAMREERLQALELELALEALTTSSRQMLRHKMAERFGGGARRQFTVSGIKANTEAFLKEYPVVLSSTYKSNTNIHSDYVFDYVIMDEASQVDIKTGALALSCAMNAVIVGDSKQLPNVVSQADALAYGAVRANYAVGDCYDAVKCSFLQSCIEVFREAPMTLLREHYRCHPKIIGFCNQRFYDGALLAMTTDEGESKVLQVVRTVEGNHARGHFNQREIDVLMQEVLPEYMGKGSLGIITPYRDQAEAINRAVGQELASTVHKYQGRECDTIIMSMVDNAPTDFSDDANLLNVAISRAKTRLCLIVTGNELPEESNLSQLINYIRYNNFEVRESKLHSVFDLLYRQYSAQRLEYQATHSTASGFLSEQLLYDALQQALSEMGRSALAVVCHYPLSKLIADPALLDAEERAFVESPFSHVDFLIYNAITKQPLLPIEVDGWGFHGGNSIQQHRDALKDGLLAKYDLSPCRISTTDRVTVEVLKELLAKRGLVGE